LHANPGFFVLCRVRALHNVLKICHHFPYQCPESRLSHNRKHDCPMHEVIREISGKDLLADVRAGLDDVALMRKYEITRRQLKALLKKLADAGVLDSIDILTLERDIRNLAADVRAGMPDQALMEKYWLSASELEAVCSKLVSKGALTQEELVRRTSLKQEGT
jgi:hypothetical protein